MLNATQPYNRMIQSNVQRGYVQWLRERERARQDMYMRYREYYDGQHNAQLTDRLRQFLNSYGDTEFTVNYCPMVVNAKADRLTITAFECEEPAQNDILWRWWRRNRLDRKQGIVHRAATRDGDTFVLVEWDAEADMPRFHYEPAFAGDGVMVYYSEERRDEIAFASKHWRTEIGPNAGKQRRMNLYYPNRIEKYVSHDNINAGSWQPYQNEASPPDDIRGGLIGTAAIYWHTDNGTETGEPLGVPVVHFKHNDIGDQYGTSHLCNVLPIQDALNKSMIDLLAVADSNGFPLLVGYGTDAWTSVKVGPGAVAAVSQPPSEARLDKLSAESPAGLLSVYNAMVMEIARVTGTPLAYFQQSGQVAAEGTLKQQEIALVSQVKKTQVDYGNAWEDALMIARRMHNAYSDQPELDTDSLIDAVWQPAETRNEKEQAEVLSIYVDNLGVSKEQAQIELGYNATQRASFARAALRQQAMQLRTDARIERPTQLPLPMPQVETAPATDDDSEELTQTELESAA